MASKVTKVYSELKACTFKNVAYGSSRRGTVVNKPD